MKLQSSRKLRESAIGSLSTGYVAIQEMGYYIQQCWPSKANVPDVEHNILDKYITMVDYP